MIVCMGKHGTGSILPLSEEAAKIVSCGNVCISHTVKKIKCMAVFMPWYTESGLCVQPHVLTNAPAH